MPERIDLQDFLPFRLNRVATVLSRRLSALYMEEYGLDIPQWRVMATLGYRETCTAQSIVCATYTHKSTISRAVSKLIAAGLVESFSSPADKREILLRFTDDGRQVYEELVPLVKKVEADIIDELGEGSYARLQQAIESLESSLDIQPVSAAACESEFGSAQK